MLCTDDVVDAREHEGGPFGPRTAAGAPAAVESVVDEEVLPGAHGRSDDLVGPEFRGRP